MHYETYQTRKQQKRVNRPLWIKLLAAFGICWLVVWGGANLVLPRIVDSMVPRVELLARSVGVGVRKFELGNIHISPTLHLVTFRDVNLEFDLAPDRPGGLPSTFTAERVEVVLTNPIKLQGRISANGFNIRFQREELPKNIPFSEFREGHVRLEGFPLLDPRQAAESILAGLRRLFITNDLGHDWDFIGVVDVKAGKEIRPALLYTEVDRGRARLRFSREDIIEIARTAEVTLSPEEIDLISHYPLRVPFLITFVSDARANAKRHFPKDHWKQDALRHVTWSYLLTQEFGPAFAKEVTDAHETLPGNTPNERAMDYHNNAMGRLLVDRDKPMGALPGLVAEGLEIINHPDEVPTWSRLLQ